MKKIVFLLTFSIQLLAFSTLLALDWGYADEDGGQPGAYLSWGAGARGLSMGKAYVGLSDDASAVYWNPAGLVQLKHREINALHSLLWEDTSYSFIAYAQPVVKGVEEKEEKKQGAIGVGLVNLGSHGFDQRNESNDPKGRTGLSETAGILSYARTLKEGLSGGVSVKIANQHIDKYSDTGYGMDIGFLWKPGYAEGCLPADASVAGKLNAESKKEAVRSYLKPLTVGLSVQNIIAPKITLKEVTDTFPRSMRIGLSYRFLNDKLIGVMDIDKTEKRAIKMHYGIEFNPYDIIGVRFGIDETEITAGFGIEVAGFDLDYAFSYHDAWSGHRDLGNSHRFGITYRWGDDAESGGDAGRAEEDVEVYSCKGVKQVEDAEGLMLDAEGKIEDKITKIIEEHLEEKMGPPTTNYQLPTSYTVVEGDCLWNIAKREDIYNNPLAWKKIYEANKDIIYNPDLIYPGQRLIIPRDIQIKPFSY